MNTGIEINFFEPAEPGVVRDGILYLDIDGKYFLEFQDNLRDRSFDPIAVAFATTTVGEQYSLINCAFNYTDYSRYRYTVNEIYKGCHVSEVMDTNCISAEARMTYLTSWMNHPRIIQKISTSIHEPGSIIIKGQFMAKFEINENLRLELCEFCGESFNRRETILKNVGYIRFISAEPISRLELFNNVTGFSKLLSIFTDTPPKLTALEFALTNEKVIERLFSEKIRQSKDDANLLLDYKKLEGVWPDVLKKFYRYRDRFVKVLDLLIESQRNNTAEVSFLNVTTAFEVYHQYFLEQQSSIREKLSSDLYSRKVVDPEPKKWIQIVRYYHILDLVRDLDYFKVNFTDIDKALMMMRDSRNYYTHYGKTRNKIWTPNQLFYINRILRQLLKAAILKQLDVPDVLINRLLNNHGAFFYHNYESNLYSENYLRSDESAN